MNIKRRSLRAAVLAVGMAAALSAGTGMSFASTSGSNGVGSGNQVNVPVKVPVDACGNAVAVIGHALAECQGGASVTGGDRDAMSGSRTSGRDGVLSGNQATVPVKAPVDVCGNAVGAIGGALAQCQGGASVAGGDDAGAGSYTSGKHGVLSGNQVNVPVKVPVNACGNSVSVVGVSLAHCPGGASVSGDDYGRAATPGAATRSDNGGTTLPIVGGLLPNLPKLPIVGG